MSRAHVFRVVAPVAALLFTGTNWLRTSEENDLKQAGSMADPLWFKDAIIYELHVRAFMDSNNDGIGDFPG